jgi:hypothetical protein
VLTRRRPSSRNHIKLTDGQYLASELANTDKYTIIWLNRNLTYMRVTASITFELPSERATYEIEKLEKTGGRIHAILHLGEDWDEAEWLVQELRENGWRATLLKSYDKAHVKVELKPDDVIVIRKVKTNFKFK